MLAGFFILNDSQGWRRAFWSSLLLMLFLVTGCTTTTMTGTYVEKKKINSPVDAIIKAFEKSTNGIRGRSQNGREFVSKYQNTKGDQYEDAWNKRERGYSRLSILGDRRPYVIQVQYVVEVKDGEAYTIVSYDDGAAKKILDKMIEFLVTRPDRNGVFDDSRGF